MVKLDKIYTRGGDQGKTSLGNGKRVGKDYPIIVALGNVDELNASLGIVRIELKKRDTTIINRIQNDLFDLGADLCVPIDAKIDFSNQLRITEQQIERLEKEIDDMNKNLPPLNSFILPGGNINSSRLHLSRTICRRCEIEIVKLSNLLNINLLVCKYINRLSDHLFVMARLINSEDNGDILWTPGKNR